ncbi:MAG: type II toxin-antitoxin system PrlF family antitoxin [Trueperaceae bacterium]
MPTRDSSEVLLSESTLTSRGQTTIPSPIRKALGLTAADKIRFVLHDDNTVTLTRAEQETENDPIVKRFLQFLEQDTLENPTHLQALTPTVISRARSLVEGVEVDLEVPLEDDDE